MFKKIILPLICALLCLSAVSCDNTDYSVTYIDCGNSADCAVRQLYESNSETVYKKNGKLDFQENLAKLLKKKPQTVICLNSDAKSDMITAAKENKETVFILQDIKSNGIPDNMICVNIDIFTASFVAGNFAGYYSRTGHCAFIADEKTSVSSRLCDGFNAGAEFASQGICDNIYASEENEDILALAEKAADSDCDIAFVYTEAHFDEIKEIFAKRSKSVIAVDKPLEGNTVLSFKPDMNKIFTDLTNKIAEGKSTGTRLTYGYRFFDLEISETADTDETLIETFREFENDVKEGNVWIDENQGAQGFE